MIPSRRSCKAYVGDPVVIRNINVGQGTNTLTIDGHQTYWEPRYRDASGVESSPIDTIHTGVSEKFTLVLKGGAGGPEPRRRRLPLPRRREPSLRVRRVGPPPRAPDRRALHAQAAARVSARRRPSCATCPTGAPVHTFAISAVDLPSTAAGGGRDGRKAAFVPHARQAAAVRNRPIFPEPLVLHVAAGECIQVTLQERAGPGSRPRSTSAPCCAISTRVASTSATTPGDQTVPPGGTQDLHVLRRHAEAREHDDLRLRRRQRRLGRAVRLDRGRACGFHVHRPPVRVWPPTSARWSMSTCRVSRTTATSPLILADQDPRIGQDTMPYPRDVSGPALVNYRQVLDRVIDANMFSSTVVRRPDHAAPAGVRRRPGQGARARRARPASSCTCSPSAVCRGPPTCTSTNSSQCQSRAVGPWEKLDIKVAGGAGGVTQQPGDYFYGDIRRPFTEAGMWGLFRVLPNTCARRAAPRACVCLEPPPSGTNTPATGTVTISDTTPTEDQALGATSVTQRRRRDQRGHARPHLGGPDGADHLDPGRHGCHVHAGRRPGRPGPARGGHLRRPVPGAGPRVGHLRRRRAPSRTSTTLPDGVPILELPPCPQEARARGGRPGHDRRRRRPRRSHLHLPVAAASRHRGVHQHRRRHRVHLPADAGAGGAEPAGRRERSPTTTERSETASLGRDRRGRRSLRRNRRCRHLRRHRRPGQRVRVGWQRQPVRGRRRRRPLRRRRRRHPQRRGRQRPRSRSASATGSMPSPAVRTPSPGSTRSRRQANDTVIGLRSLASVEAITANGFSGVTIVGSATANTLNFGAVTLTGIGSIDGGAGQRHASPARPSPTSSSGVRHSTSSTVATATTRSPAAPTTTP